MEVDVMQGDQTLNFLDKAADRTGRHSLALRRRRACCRRRRAAASTVSLQPVFMNTTTTNSGMYLRDAEHAAGDVDVGGDFDCFIRTRFCEHRRRELWHAPWGRRAQCRRC